MKNKTVDVDTFSCEYAEDGTGCMAKEDEDQMKLAVGIYCQYFYSCGLALNQDKCSPLFL